MEIKVGEYVRTIHGEIAIFKGWNNNPKSQWSCKLEFQKNKTWKYCCEEYIKSHSAEIIGIIEVGDFVNGFPVLEPVYNGNVMYGIDEGYENFRKAFGEIKSIVTHEQFAEMEYKV